MGELTTYFDHIKDKTQIQGISAIVSDSTLSFGVWDKHNHLIKAGTFGKFSGNAKEALTKEVGHYPIKLMSNQVPFLLVDTNQIKADNRKDFFQHLTPDSLMEISSIQDYSFNNQSKSLLYGLKKASLGSQSTMHLMAALTDKLLSLSSKEAIIIHIEKDTLSILAKKDGNVCFANQFSCISQVDFLYYTELVAQQFKMKKETLSLYYTGRVGEDSNIVKLLDQYFHTVSPLTFKKNISENKDVNDAHFQDLYLALQCG